MDNGRVTGPSVTVDAVDTDEGAMLNAETAATLCDLIVKTSYGLSSGKAIIGTYPVQCTDLADVELISMIAMFDGRSEFSNWQDFLFWDRQAHENNCIGEDLTCGIISSDYARFPLLHLISIPHFLMITPYQVGLIQSALPFSSNPITSVTYPARGVL